MTQVSRQATAPPTATPTATLTRVALNGKWLAQRRTGTQRFAEEIARRLVLDPRLDVLLCLPQDAAVPDWLPATVPGRRSRPRGGAFEQVALPQLARGRLLVSLAGPAPVVVGHQVATFHDATPFRFPNTYTRAFGAWHRSIYRLVSRRARAVVTVSEFSAVELATVLHRPRELFHVVGNGSEHLSALTPMRPDSDLPQEGFVLVVGTLALHKNLPGVLRAVADARLPTVVVGARGPARVFSGASPTVGDDDVITYAAHLTDAELAWLYRHAGALVFPSRYEGFGLPVVEAQALGCPVVAARSSSLPEVAGQGALFVDPDRPQDVPSMVRELIADPARRAEMVAAGSVNAARFTWATSASRLGDVLVAVGSGR